eukprot:TRINITY_DN15864_c0_g1_i1.p1 TRINITY_DN15864_c0_g1~~TRINITY_DN15864_c0_g1_i1.p1  ORF type:complete len:1020 (+),score=270.92 TRINITY_DN15864_c0_g1_i1:103-3162(+)
MATSLMAGMVQVCSRRFEKGKSRGMKSWHKRYAILVVDGDGAKLKFFKNDRDVVELAGMDLPAARGDKRREYSVAVSVRGQSYKMRCVRRDERDKWLEALCSVYHGSRGGGDDGFADDYLELFRDRILDWQDALQEAANADVKLQFDVASFGVQQSTDHAACFAVLSKGRWCNTLRAGLVPLSQASGFQRPVVQRVAVRRSKVPGGAVYYDKVSYCLHVLLDWDSTEGALHVVSGEDISHLLSVPRWQADVDRLLESDSGWQAGCRRLQRLLGTTARVVCDFADDVTAEEARRWADAWLTGDDMTVLANAVELAVRDGDAAIRSVPVGCPPLPQACVVLSAWAQGVSLHVTRRAIHSSEPPIVSVHRSNTRNTEESVGLSRQSDKLFSKCRAAGDDARTGPALLCSAALSSLRFHLADAVHTARFVELARQSERIVISASVDTQVLFAMNWEDFVACCRELGTSPKVRFQLALQIAAMYPARAQSLADGLGSDLKEFALMLPRVSITFRTDAVQRRTGAEGSALADVVIMRRERREGSQTTVSLRYDVVDLASYAAGILTGVHWRQSSLMQLPDPAAAGSSSEASASTTPRSSSDDDDKRAERRSSWPRHQSASPGSFGRRRSLSGESFTAPLRREHGPTEYAEMPSSEGDATGDIMERITAHPLAAVYPVRPEAIRRCCVALQREFAPERISARTTADVVSHAVSKLRQLFEAQDPSHTGRVRVSEVAGIAEAFEEYESAPGTGAEGLAARITETARGRDVSFESVGQEMLEELMPSNVWKSVQSKRSVLLCGLPNAGKTLLLCALHQRAVDSTSATVGSRPEVVRVGRVNLSISEVGGGLEERRSWSLRSKRDGVHGVCFVVDSARSELFDAARQYLREILLSKHLKGVPLLLLLNNTRSRAARSTPEVLQELKVIKYCGKGKRRFDVHRVHIVSPSDLDEGAVGTAVVDAFRWLAGEMIPVPKRSRKEKGKAPNRDESPPVPKLDDDAPLQPRKRYTDPATPGTHPPSRQHTFQTL